MINLNTKKALSAMILASMLTLGTGLAADTNYCAPAKAEQFTPLQGKVIYVPSGTSFPATATMELSSESLELGQSVCIALSQDFYYNNTLVAPIGSSVNGTVIQVKKAGRAGINGQLMVKFTNIITPYGQMIPISGKIQTEDGSGLIKGGTKLESATEYAKDIAIGSAAGAVAGVIMGPLSGGKVGKGAVYGTAVGAGVGVATTIWDKGEPATVPAGTVVNIVLDQQMTFTPQKK